VEESNKLKAREKEPDKARTGFHADDMCTRAGSIVSQAISSIVGKFYRDLTSLFTEWWDHSTIYILGTQEETNILDSTNLNDSGLYMNLLITRTYCRAIEHTVIVMKCFFYFFYSSGMGEDMEVTTGTYFPYTTCTYAVLEMNKKEFVIYQKYNNNLMH